MRAVRASFAPLAAAATCALLLAPLACSVEEGVNASAVPCGRGGACEEGLRCVSGFCVRLEDGGAGSRDGSVEGGGSNTLDGGAGSEPCAKGDQGREQECFVLVAEGEPNCRLGRRRCADGAWSACEGQGTMSAPVELCNGEDDDCDIAIDELLESAACRTPLEGVCGDGRWRCDRNRAVCEAMAPSAEVCNGEDDDCDGAIDEADTTAASCYTGESGCVLGGDGAYECTGMCAAGMRECIAGVAPQCEREVTPAQESCERDVVTALAADEDCDATTDEGCLCDQNARQGCYEGPPATLDVGECDRGEQLCGADGSWGSCLGQTLPAPETCGNAGADDDCDGVPDDVPTLGDPCTGDVMGRCRNGTLECAGDDVACVTPEPRTETCDGTDDDCDGHTDEGFDLGSDEAHCGACGNDCAEGEACCGRQCVLLVEDEQHCGSCDVACQSDQVCCAGQCANLDTSTAHCGVCGKSCAQGEVCCTGECANLDDDESHCGDCAKTCVATSRPDCCGGECVNTQSDEINCGECGKACAQALPVCCSGDCGTALCL